MDEKAPSGNRAVCPCGKASVESLDGKPFHMGKVTCSHCRATLVIENDRWVWKQNDKYWN